MLQAIEKLSVQAYWWAKLLIGVTLLSVVGAALGIYVGILTPLQVILKILPIAFSFFTIVGLSELLKSRTHELAEQTGVLTAAGRTTIAGQRAALDALLAWRGTWTGVLSSLLAAGFAATQRSAANGPFRDTAVVANMLLLGIGVIALAVLALQQPNTVASRSVFVRALYPLFLFLHLMAVFFSIVPDLPFTLTAQGRVSEAPTPTLAATASPIQAPSTTTRVAPQTPSAFRRNTLLSSGQLTHEGPGKGLVASPIGIKAADFIAEARFFNPYDANVEKTAWDYGFVFRHTGPNQEYRIFVTSDGRWLLLNLPGTPTAAATPVSIPSSTKGSGLVNLALGAGEANVLTIVANGPSGFFFVNGFYVGTLDLSERTESGDVQIATGFLNPAQIKDRVTKYESYSVLSP